MLIYGLRPRAEVILIRVNDDDPEIENLNIVKDYNFSSTENEQYSVIIVRRPAQIRAYYINDGVAEPISADYIVFKYPDSRRSWISLRGDRVDIITWNSEIDEIYFH